MTIAIIDYGSGNLRSVAKALEQVTDDPSQVRLTRSAESVAEASHIILPGVGAFADCMSGLKSLPGMIETLRAQVLDGGKKFLGICVGMQMLFETGYEHGVHTGLGWLKGEVLPLVAPSLKIPHMGWNDLRVLTPHPLLADINTGDHAYFVHSYHARCTDAADVIATTSYGQTVTAVVARGNIMGTQFHPEKSQDTGLTLLRNFLNL